MPVIRNQPLPDDHPLKRGPLIFVQKRPSSSDKSSTSTAPTQEPSTKPQGWTEEDFRRGEEALANLMKQNPPKILSD